MKTLNISLSMMICSALSVNSQPSQIGSNPGVGCLCCSNPANAISNLDVMLYGSGGVGGFNPLNTETWQTIGKEPGGVKDVVAVGYELNNPNFDMSKCCLEIRFSCGADAADRDRGIIIKNPYLGMGIEPNSTCIGKPGKPPSAHVVGTIPKAIFTYVSIDQETGHQITKEMDVYLEVMLFDKATRKLCDTKIVDIWIDRNP